MRFATVQNGHMVVQDEYPNESLPSSQACAGNGGHDLSRGSLEYARSCGLAIDYGSIDRFALISHLTTTFPPLQDDQYGRSVTIFKIPPAPPSVQEKLVLTKAASALLQDICTSLSLAEVEALAQSHYSHPLRRFKLELPLLPSDPEEECRDFLRQVRAIGWVNLETARLPLIPVDVEKDEGLEFPSRISSYDDEFMKRIVLEKPEIGIGRDTLLHLQEAFEASWTEKDQGDLWDSLHKHKRVRPPP
jgi:hypothetical protein